MLYRNLNELHLYLDIILNLNFKINLLHGIQGDLKLKQNKFVEKQLTKHIKLSSCLLFPCNVRKKV